MSAAPAIDTSGLSKQYGVTRALEGVDLRVAPGEVFALLGPNGAGKTTLVEILEGYRRRSSGEVRVLGVDPQGADLGWRARIGVVLQSTAIFDELTVAETVSHFATFYPHPMDVSRVLGLVGLQEKRAARCKTLSGGQRRRVDVALGLVGDPELIFLDEPTTGFDPGARRHAWDVIRELTALGKTTLLTTHYLDEAEALADRVGVLIEGRLLEVGPPHEIGGRSRRAVHVSFSREGALADGALPAVDGRATEDGAHVTIKTRAPTTVVAALAAWARERGAGELPALTVTRPSLEDVYLSMLDDAQTDERGAND